MKQKKVVKVQAPSRIFKSNLRGCEETATYKCLSTFNFKNYQDEFKESFGQLTFFNDEFLSPQASMTYKHEEDTQVFLLPLEGALNYCNGVDKEEFVKSEQIKVFAIEKGLSYTLKNPFEKERINYLHIGFRINASQMKHKSFIQDIKFNKMNELVSVGFKKGSENQRVGYIGIYEGRSKEDYILKNSKNGVFVYVVTGAFDVHGRLLEYRDGLSLWDIKEIEFEALSNNAIIMLLEINLN